MDIRYLKTNYYFLGVVFIVTSLLTYFLLRRSYPKNFNKNVPIAIIAGMIIVVSVYYIPLKTLKSIEPYDDVLHKIE